LLSPITSAPFGTDAVVMPVADVLLSGAVVCGVPIAAMNHELLYAQLMTPVELRRGPSGRLEITGLSQRARGFIHQFSLHVPTGVVTTGTVFGFAARTLTLAELEGATPGGFGETPLASLALFDAYGRFLRLIGAGGGVTPVVSSVPLPPSSAVSTTLSTIVVSLPTATSPSATVSATAPSATVSGAIGSPTSTTSALVSVPTTSTGFTVTTVADSGTGSLRDVLTRAVAAGGNVTIRFAVGGTIRLRTHLPAITRDNIFLLGETAPSPVILDGALCAAPSSGRGVIDITRCSGGLVRGLTIQNFVNGTGLDGVRLKFSVNHWTIEDVTCSSWGADEGFSLADICRGIVFRRCHARGTQGVRAFLVSNQSTATLEDCTVDGCRGGVLVSDSGSTANCFRCRATDSHYGLWTRRAAVINDVDGVYSDLSDTGVYVDGANVRLLRTQVLRVDGTGLRARRGPEAGGFRSSLRLIGCTVRDCTNDGRRRAGFGGRQPAAGQ
jgi:hypothetical protein